MKRAVPFCLVVSLMLAGCGLKVPVTVVAGEGGQAGAGLDETAATGIDGATTGGSAASGPGAAGQNAGGPAGSAGDLASGGAGLFDRETEGVTQNTLRLCTHVPITGAAPIPHHPERFGQFYFDYVNDELGGIYGRKITFDAIDDRYNTAGAIDAANRCARGGAFAYFGAAGTDQIVSVAKWAERNRVPYIHGPTSDKDLEGLKYNVHAGPTYEHQHELLAKYLVREFGKDKNYATIKVRSPYFEAGANAFRAAMKKLGVNMRPDITVEKDENNFSSVYFELQDDDIDVINNFTTPNVWIRLLKQRPPTYDPVWSAVSPVAGFNIVAQALTGSGKAIVFHHFGPACQCATYKDEEISQHKDLPWYSDIREFLRIFKKYSPQQDPPPDDFDYASYLTAKSIHRLLLKVGPAPTRSKLWALFTTYKETKAQAFPGCGADFTRNKLRMGAWRVNIFELQSQQGTWKQIEDCVDDV